MVAKGFRGVDHLSNELNNGELLTTFNAISNFSGIYFEEDEEDLSAVVPFVACGKSEALDPDMNYSLTHATDSSK